ncbi:hypothetical protein [Streptomyces vietnamensis]|uniref:hypothetical protein n=1 Tax=Streptomyces vietnamensis TaxID=362257 RepID=UPI003441132B
MRLFTRKPKPAPTAVSPQDVAAGLMVFAADLIAGDYLAVESVGPLGEMPFTPEQWAAYPQDPERRARLGGQALAAAAEGLVVLAAEKQASGNPETDAQIDALLDAAALIARDIPDHR